MAIKLPIVSEFDKKGILQAERTLNQFGKNVGIAFAAVGAGVLAAGVALGKFSLEAIKGSEQAAIAQRRLDQIGQSMGIFGEQAAAVTQRLGEFAEANELIVAVDADVIKSTQAKLLTFAAIAETADEAGGAFDRATVAAIDLAAAGFGSAESNAIQLGKALNDPIKGLTALTRSGVTFTNQEKENIKVLVESGKTLEAQDLILQAIEKQVGGTAKATASAFTIMELATNQIKDAFGDALLPVFEEFTDAVVDLTPAISDALVPVSEYLAKVFREQVLPAIQNFTKWLASPQGIKTVKDLTQAVIDGIANFVQFGKVIFDNWNKITAAIGVIGTLIISVKTLTTVVEVAKAAQLAWNIALVANPIGLLIAALAVAAVAVIAFTKDVNADTIALKKNQNQVTALEQEQIQLQEKIKQGGLGLGQYKNQLIKVNDKLMEAKTGFSTSAGEANRFNNIKLSGVNREIDSTANKLNGLFNKFGETTAEARRFAALKPETKEEEETGGGGSGEPTAAEKAAEARKKVQELIRDTRRRVQDAQKDYREAVAAADKAFTENDIKIRRDYAQKLADVIQQSKDRIRDAFKAVATYSVATFLSDFKQVEDARLRTFEDAKKAAEELGQSFTQVFTAGDPVQAYLENLRAKVNANKKILAASAKLLEAGFSQTFIEQIISTGSEGGIALAEGILASNPAIISEIQTLYKDIENVAETGANALADQIYAKQGLATQQLQDLYDKTNRDLLEALADNFTEYTTSLDDAATVLKEAITDITRDFNDAITEMGDNLGGLAGTIKQFRDFLNGVTDSTTSATNPLSPKNNKTSGVFTPQPFDIDFALGLPKGTYAAGNSGVTQTVINVNVATDATQSTAMVGKAVGETITKYVRTGGQVIVA